MAANLNGIVINEILTNPFGDSGGFDTDKDGTVEDKDEFIELYNTTDSDIDISGYQIYDNKTLRHTFDENTVIPAGGYFSLTAENSDLGQQFINNRGDAIALLDPDSNEYIVAYAGPIDRTASVPDDATLIGADDLGDRVKGESLQRIPDGSDDVVSFTPTPGVMNECFVTGTQILTDSGYRRVEELKIGDVAQTADGKLEPIKWIGKQTVDPSEIKNSLRGNPVLIKAGALGDNLPVRDLYTSPDHAYLVDGLLINAGALVNGVSIVQTEPTETFYYYHVELEQHSLLVAEGASAESFFPNQEDRLTYDNGAEYEELYPHGSKLMLWPMDYPRVSAKHKVPNYINQKLMQIAKRLYGEVLETA